MLKAPQRQTAEDTITTLSSRLTSATLLEDKRASILGLRSFAKQYPASVASGSLRDLINSLREHGAGLGKEDGGGDLDTARSVLETLLMLFNPDKNSAEASEDIALWLADEFTQRQDNITILLDLLECPDYYARIYSLQLLTSISASRPERTQECILSAPLGTARLVGVLDDGRDAVRDAALILLVDLTNVSQTELQKLIAFEDVYMRLFRLMQSEGGVAEGGVVIQDCLSLLANLIRHSTSNQSLFRESGCVPRLIDSIKQASLSIPEENEFSRSNREKNTWGILAVIRLFLEKGEPGTKANQDIFWKSGLVQNVLDLAFNAVAPPPIRSIALRTCADMIIANQPLQETFAALQVIEPGSHPQPLTNGSKNARAQRTYVIEALLGLVLGSASADVFDLRLSATILIKGYFYGHERIKHHFLQRAIAGYIDGEDEASNGLSALMGGPDGSRDPLRFVLAGDIISQLLFDDVQAKQILMDVSQGNAEKGEDVITATQTLSGHLTYCLENDADPRVAVAYLRVLETLLFESQPAVNDCLAEASSLLTALISTTSQSQKSQLSDDPIKSLLPGLCAVLLGTIYEFSSKDSPIPRRTLQPFLVARLGRQKYFDALRQLRQHPIVRDSEIINQIGGSQNETQALFDPNFVDFLKDEYGRLRRAIDKDPGIEVIAKTEAGVDRDVLDDLRAQLASRDQTIQQLEAQDLENRQKADQAGVDFRRELQGLQSSQRSMESEVERIKRINDALQRDHEAELDRLQNDMNNEMERLQNTSKSSAQATHQQHEREMERLKGQHGASLASERSLWEERTRKAGEQATLQSQDKLNEVSQTLQGRENELVVLRQEFHDAKSHLERSQEEVAALRTKSEQLDQDLQKTKALHMGLQDVNTKAMARVRAIEEENKRNEARVNELVKERDQAVSEHDKSRNKIDELQEEVEGLKLELAEERKGYSELENELEEARKNTGVTDEHKGKVAQLEKDLQAHSKSVETEKEEAKKARTELEDMLMVMSDLEVKKNDYKSRLQKLGEEVSDDEGEDEDEEDDDNDVE